jgi:drug/metabolite transporter (DMT)-like permease
MFSIPPWLVFAGIALLLWGASGITQKLATNLISSPLSFLWFALAMIAISVAVMFLEPMNWHVRPLVFWLAAAGGALNGLGALTSFAALESGGKASIVISVVSLYPLVTVGFAVSFLRERITALQVIGIVLAIVAVVLLSQESRPSSTISLSAESPEQR